MLVPVLLHGTAAGVHREVATAINGPQLNMQVLMLSLLIHTGAMLIVAGTLALLFFELYDRVGLGILRSTWFNFDLVWAVALLIAACALILS